MVVLHGQLGERPALHGDRRARLDGPGLSELVGSLLGRPLVDVAVAPKPGDEFKLPPIVGRM
jgi:hypothetical protein